MHLVDLAPFDESDPVENFHTIERELKRYSEGIANKQRRIVFTKADLLGPQAEERAEYLAGHLGVEEYNLVSTVTGLGISELIYQIEEQLRESKDNSSSSQILQEVHEFSSKRRQEIKNVRKNRDREDELPVVRYEP